MSVVVEYVLNLERGKTIVIPLRFAEPAFVIEIPDRPSWPAWTRLKAHRCPCCSLGDDAVSCPLARALVGIVETVSDVVSHETVDAEVRVSERRVVARTTADDALRSLLGLVMPASGCPRTAAFRPMARFHLPFSTPEETLYRVCSMHRLTQWFRARAGLGADPGFDALASAYADLAVVNAHVARRLQDAAGRDGARSAVALLDVFAQMLPFSFEEPLGDLATLFLPGR